MAIGSDICPDAAPALVVWQRSMSTCDHPTALKAFSTLCAITTRRQVSAEELTIQNRIYVSKFMQYPETLVREVVHAWPDRKGGEWFPSLKELTDALKSKLKFRNALGGALKAWGTPSDIERRIKLIRFDVSRADMGHTPKGGDVPDYMRGLQGSELADAMPRYKADMDARIKQLEALL